MALEKEEEEEGKEVLYDREDGGKGEGGSASKDAEERGGDAESCKTWMGGKGEGDKDRGGGFFYFPLFSTVDRPVGCLGNGVGGMSSVFLLPRIATTHEERDESYIFPLPPSQRTGKTFPSSERYLGKGKREKETDPNTHSQPGRPGPRHLADFMQLTQTHFRFCWPFQERQNISYVYSFLTARRCF